MLPPVSKKDNWSQETLNKLTLREKIAQMMIYRMNLRMKDISVEKWEKILELIDRDGIGGLHFWYGDAGTSLTMLNAMQERSKCQSLLMQILNMVYIKDFPEGTRSSTIHGNSSY